MGACKPGITVDRGWVAGAVGVERRAPTGPGLGSESMPSVWLEGICPGLAGSWETIGRLAAATGLSAMQASQPIGQEESRRQSLAPASLNWRAEWLLDFAGVLIRLVAKRGPVDFAYWGREVTLLVNRLDRLLRRASEGVVLLVAPVSAALPEAP